MANTGTDTQTPGSSFNRKFYGHITGTGDTAVAIGFMGKEEIYDTLKDSLGLEDLSANTNFKGIATLRNPIRDKSFTPITISYKEGNKIKSGRVLCHISAIQQALGSLPGKQYKGNKISGAGLPRKLSYS